MIFKNTEIDHVVLIDMEKNIDERWYFARNFCINEFRQAWIPFEIIQINHSFNKIKWTTRGLHFQKDPKWESKIVQCLKWSAFYVVVDTRKESKTFKKYLSFKLRQWDWVLIYAWNGIANGFQTLEDDTIIQYYMWEFFDWNLATWIKWNDPELNINWPMQPTIISDKDNLLPLIKSI